MNSFVYFIAILTKITEAKPIIVPIDGEKFLTISDLKDLKILILSFIALNAFQFLKWFGGLFFGDQKSLKENVNNLQRNAEKMFDTMTVMQRDVARIADSQLTETEVRTIVRDERQHERRIKNGD